MRDAPDIIKRLVEAFDRNIEAYRSAEYNEAQLRAEFLLPMFRALGWDVQVHKGGDLCLIVPKGKLCLGWLRTFGMGNPNTIGYL